MWRPQHIIIGGWVEGTPRGQMVAQAIEFLKTFEDRDKLLAPYSPRLFGCIVKAKCLENKLTETAWKLQKMMEGRMAPPKWATVERSPEAGAQRRAVRYASDAARNIAGEKAVIDGTGAIRFGAKDACRWSTRTRTWEKRRAWTALATDIHMDFDEWLRRCVSAQM